MTDYIHHLAWGDGLDQPALRLTKALETLGFEGVSAADVLDLLMEEMDFLDLAYAKQLAMPQDPAVWHRVTLGPGAPLIQERQDILNVAESEVAALAFLMEEIDFTRTPVTSVSIADQAIQLRGPDGLVATVEPIVFEPTNPLVRDRVERSLKGIRYAGEEEKLLRRLADIPGLGAMEAPHIRSDLGPRGSAFSKTPASLCAVLRDMLKRRLSIDVKLHQSQQLLAAMFGAASWYSLERYSGEDRVWLSPVCVDLSAESEEGTRVSFYRNLACGLWGLGKAIQEWAGSPIRLELASTYGVNGPYIAATLASDVARRKADFRYWAPPVMSFSYPPVVNAGETYLAAAARILGERDDRDRALLSFFGASVVDVNQRLGVPPDHTLTIRNWVFSLEGATAGPDCTLHFERFDRDNRRVESFRIRRNHARIGRATGTGGLGILSRSKSHAQNEREHWLDLEQFSRDEVHQILAFLDVRDTDLTAMVAGIRQSLH